MRRFNLEDAKKGKPLITRDGRVVDFICVLSNIPAPLLVSVRFNTIEKKIYGRDGNTGRMENYFPNGRYNQVHPTNMDLFIDEL